MVYITNDKTTDDGVAVKEFYKLVEMEKEDGTKVMVKQLIWEFNKQYLEDMLFQAQANITDIQEKLSFYA